MCLTIVTRGSEYRSRLVINCLPNCFCYSECQACFSCLLFSRMGRVQGNIASIICVHVCMCMSNGKFSNWHAHTCGHAIDSRAKTRKWQLGFRVAKICHTECLAWWLLFSWLISVCYLLTGCIFGLKQQYKFWLEKRKIIDLLLLAKIWTRITRSPYPEPDGLPMCHYYSISGNKFVCTIFSRKKVKNEKLW